MALKIPDEPHFSIEHVPIKTSPPLVGPNSTTTLKYPQSSVQPQILGSYVGQREPKWGATILWEGGLF